MAAQFPSDDPYLANGFEPIHIECDCADVTVSGAIPGELSGTYYRIGPNPQYAPRSAYNPMLADGMVHAFRIQGRRVAYRNRWVRTRQFVLERAAGRALFATSGNKAEHDPEVAHLPTDGVANTHVIWHGHRLLALEEGHAPIELDPVTLDTKGVWDFEGRLPANMTAHPKIDPQTGEMIFFANFFDKSFSGRIACYTADRHGRLVQDDVIDGPFPSFVHDFAVTRDFVVFFVCPVSLSLERARTGQPVIAWDPSLRTHVGVFPRGSTAKAIRWFTGDPCMAWHSVNAFNEGDNIFVDVCAQRAPAFPSVDGTLPRADDLKQFLTRWTLDWAAPGAYTVDRLSPTVCEYPRIDERYSGSRYRYAYVACAGGPGTGDLFHRAIGRFDAFNRQMTTYAFGPRCAVSEPVFVPRDGASREGGGFLLATVFDETRNSSHLAILDAERPAAGPIARALVDHRIPMGFHGSWRPDAAVRP